jgi:hypothetical protein
MAQALGPIVKGETPFAPAFTSTNVYSSPDGCPIWVDIDAWASESRITSFVVSGYLSVYRAWEVV